MSQIDTAKPASYEKPTHELRQVAKTLEYKRARYGRLGSGLMENPETQAIVVKVQRKWTVQKGPVLDGSSVAPADWRSGKIVNLSWVGNGTFVEVESVWRDLPTVTEQEATQ